MALMMSWVKKIWYLTSPGGIADFLFAVVKYSFSKMCAAKILYIAALLDRNWRGMKTIVMDSLVRFVFGRYDWPRSILYGE